MLPERYIEHGAQIHQIEEAGLSATNIAAMALSLIGKSKDRIHLFGV